MSPCASSSSFSQLDVNGMKEREQVTRLQVGEGSGGREGWKKAACEFLFYCLFLFKKTKKENKIFRPFWQKQNKNQNKNTKMKIKTPPNIQLSHLIYFFAYINLKLQIIFTRELVFILCIIAIFPCLYLKFYLVFFKNLQNILQYGFS